MSDPLTSPDRPRFQKMIAYTQMVSCSIRNDAGPMELQDAEICLDGKGRPSNLRRSRGMLYVDSYSPFTIEVDCSAFFEHHKMPRTDPHDKEHEFDDIQAELFFDKKLVTRLITDHKNGLQKIIFAGESLEEHKYRKFKFNVTKSSFHTMRLDCSPSKIVVIIKRVRLGMEVYHPIIPGREQANNLYDVSVLETHIRPEDARFHYQMFTISCSLSQEHPAVKHEMIAPPSDRAADHPLFKAEARAGELPQGPTNPRDTFFVGNPYGTSVGAPVLDTAQALAEICPPPASPTAPSSLVPSFDSPERARPAMPLPLSPDLTPVSSQKVSSWTSSFTGWGVPCSPQPSSSTLQERRRNKSSGKRAHAIADDEERFWRGPDEFPRNDLANLLKSSESSLSSAPASPIPTTAELPGDPIGTASNVLDFVNAILPPDKLPQRTRRYQDLVGKRRGPESPNTSALQGASVLQPEVTTASVCDSPDTDHRGCYQHTGTTAPNHSSVAPLADGEICPAQQSKVARDNVPSRQEDVFAPAVGTVEPNARSMSITKAAHGAGLPSVVPGGMEIDPSDDPQSATANLLSPASRLDGSKGASERSTVPHADSSSSQSPSQAGESSASTQLATSTPQIEQVPSVVSSTQTNPTAEIEPEGTADPPPTEASLSSLRSSIGLTTLFSRPPAVTKNHALIDDVLSGPPNKKTKTTESARRSSPGCLSSSVSSTPTHTSPPTSDRGSTSVSSTPSPTTIPRTSVSTPRSGNSTKQPAPEIAKDKRARPSWKSQADAKRASVDSSRPNITSGEIHPGSMIVPRLRLTISPTVEAEHATGNRRLNTASSSTTSNLADNSKSLTSKWNPNLTTVSITADPGSSTNGTVPKFLLRKTPCAGSITPARTSNSTNPTSVRSTPSNEKEIDPLDSQEVDEFAPADVLRAVQLMDRRIFFKNVPSLDVHRAGEKRKRLAF